MNLRYLVLAAAVAVAAAPAFAADQIITLSPTGATSYSASFAALAAAGGSLVGNPQSSVADSILSDGNDLITFVGAAPGVYNVGLNGSSSFISALTATLNLLPITVTSLPGGVFSIFTTITTLSPTFALSLSGTPQAFAADALNAQYSGNITVTAVPEPETYALLLAGLAAMGFVARRRRPHQ